MCCFSRPVRLVSSTRIFARPLPGERQLLVYGMSLSLSEDVAMVLPIPVPAGSPEDAVRFVDLSGEPRFLETIDDLFPQELLYAKSRGLLAARSLQSRPKLSVQAVGDFEASFVPSQADFDRLDERFRLPKGVWEKLPGYSDWGFCVFKLRPGRGIVSALKSIFSKVRKVHPMAFDFPTRGPKALFFPTVHVHDGDVHETAAFDHSLYCQPDPTWESMIDWERSERPAPAFSRVELTSAGAPVYRTSLRGELPNEDTLLDEAKLLRRNGFGPSFRLRMHAAWERVKNPADKTVALWNRVTEEERVRIKEAILAELSPLFAENTTQWGLRPFQHDLPVVLPHFHEVVREALPPDMPMGCLVPFYASNDVIESQMLSVAFAAMPPKPPREAIQKAFQAALDRATGVTSSRSVP